jgi:hypothetical protein
MALKHAVRREMRVAFSRTVQPAWLRVLKWTIFIGISVMLRRTTYFWWWIIGLPGAGLIVHFFWRWKTHGWTRSWNGWDDVEAVDRE